MREQAHLQYFNNWWKFNNLNFQKLAYNARESDGLNKTCSENFPVNLLGTTINSFNTLIYI